MFPVKRAMGFAMTSFIVATSATYAGPSFAWDGAPIEIPSLGFDHAIANPANEPVGDAPATPDMSAYGSDVMFEPGEEADGRSLSELVASYTSKNATDKEHECLAEAVYFEAKGESLQGQLAVAEVILNRVNSGRFPASICGVVKQKSQFSFVRSGHIPTIPKSSAAWSTAVAIAYIASQNLDEAGVGGAMFFHARYVSPKWRRLTRVASIGNHIFYR
jgi:hypothetical protein